MKSKSYQQILLGVNMGEFYKAVNLKPHLLNAGDGYEDKEIVSS